MTRIGSSRRRAHRAGLALLLAAGLGAALGVMPASAASTGVWCSTLGRRAPVSAGKPVELTAGIGSTQSTPAGNLFPIRLAVTVTDAEGNPVQSVLVTFSAPLSGASGRFTVRGRVFHSDKVEVKTNACGIAVAPAFTANHTQGGYVVKATIKHARPVAFALANLAPGRSS